MQITISSRPPFVRPPLRGPERIETPDPRPTRCHAHPGGVVIDYGPGTPVIYADEHGVEMCRECAFDRLRSGAAQLDPARPSGGAGANAWHDAAEVVHRSTANLRADFWRAAHAAIKTPADRAAFRALLEGEAA